ncbi:hypothetical protein GZH47_11525 [Paenibacillus rhizovicinus]|uniref:Uncharacterized protein n=1 Tax=Paenibacillus rhizovicinus TaxID=2704463 RepID=A0A6C0NYT4_9BACL|nr:hypothetical protein [Paenibacillus rhizovicinus]QHW31410.1 hypothetical protein GZH47_11525 [Paenibacillus rhizovicinus]
MSVNGIGSSSNSVYQNYLSMLQTQAQSSAYAPITSEPTAADADKSADGTSASGTSGSSSKQQDAQALLSQLQFSSPSLLDFLNGNAAGSNTNDDADDLSLPGLDNDSSSVSDIMNFDPNAAVLQAFMNNNSDSSESADASSKDPFALLLNSFGAQSNTTNLASLLEQAYSKTSVYEDDQDAVPGQVVNKVN